MCLGSGILCSIPGGESLVSEAIRHPHCGQAGRSRKFLFKNFEKHGDEKAMLGTQQKPFFC
eukprot:1158800-Pelagomonas_calceolata.AAC.1